MKNLPPQISSLFSRRQIGAKFSLDGINFLCSRLGHPEKDLRFIHIAGTNGKGSTCAMIASILMQAGYQVGLYSSPHLESFQERIQIQGQPIGLSDLEELFGAWSDITDKQVKQIRNIWRGWNEKNIRRL